MVLRPEKEDGGRGDLPQMGPRLRHRRQDHRRSALPRHAPGRAKSPTCRSRNSATRRRNMTARGSSRSSRRRSPPTMSRRPTIADALLKLLGSPDLSLAPLGLGAVRHADPGQFAAASRRRCRRGARRRPRHQGARLLLRRDAALLRGRSLSRAASRRSPNAGATSPPSAPSRSPPPTTSISAIPSGPRSWASWSSAIKGIGEACRALDFPIVSGNVSLYNETNGHGILPTPTIGGVGLLADLVADGDASASSREGEAILLVGARMAAPISASRSICARSSAARTARRRRSTWRTRSALGDFVRSLIRVGDVDRGARSFRWRPRRRRWPKWRWPRASAPRSTSSRTLEPIPQFFGEDQGRYVVDLPPRAGRAGHPGGQGGRRPGQLDRQRHGELLLAILGLATVPLSQLRSAHEAWFPAFMAGEV